MMRMLSVNSLGISRPSHGVSFQNSGFVEHGINGEALGQSVDLCGPAGIRDGNIGALVLLWVVMEPGALRRSSACSSSRFTFKIDLAPRSSRDI